MLFRSHLLGNTIGSGTLFEFHLDPASSARKPLRVSAFFVLFILIPLGLGVVALSYGIWSVVDLTNDRLYLINHNT